MQRVKNTVHRVFKRKHTFNTSTKIIFIFILNIGKLYIYK